MKCKAYSSFYEDAAVLYPEIKVYGPYIRKDGRKIVILYDGKSRSGRQYARVKLEIKLGRKLTSHEEVDHKDGNFRNDKFRNLQLLSSEANRLKQAVQTHGAPIDKFCTYCDTFIKVVYTVSARNRFCSNSCRSQYYGANQHGNKISGYS